MVPERSISHLSVMAVSQEPGLRSDRPPLCSNARVVFIVTWLSEGFLRVVWVTASIPSWGRQRVTVVGNCTGRLSCKACVFRQLASRWANGGAAVSWAGANGSDCVTFLTCLSEQREIPRANKGHPPLVSPTVPWAADYPLRAAQAL